MSVGELDIEKLKLRITRRQFRGWMHYATLEPFGEQRADLRAGIVAAAIRNAMRTGGTAYRPTDFMPRFGVERRQDDDQIAAAVLSYCRAHNARVARMNERAGNTPPATPVAAPQAIAGGN